MGLLGNEKSNRESDPINLLSRFVNKELNINFPENTDSKLKQPRKWMIRGVPFSERLLGDSELRPNPGMDGTYGVFFGDCASAIIARDNFLFYIADSKRFSPWIEKTSKEYKKLLEKYASEKGFNLSNFGQYFETERLIYESRNVYDSKSGVCTVHNSIQSLEVDYRIVMNSGKLEVIF